MNVTGKNFRANNGLRVTISPVEPSDDTPSVSLSLDSSLREGAGKRPPQCQSPARWSFRQRAGDFLGFCVGFMFYHSTGCLRNRGVTGDFHRPYEALKFLHFTIH